MELDIRWKQRFENYEKSLRALEYALSVKTDDITHRAGIIQFFEMTGELSWKMIKDYLTNQGFNDVKSPRQAYKKAFEINLISDGESWLQLLLDRNLTSHTYNEETAREVETLILEKYYPIFKTLYDTFKAKYHE